MFFLLRHGIATRIGSKFITACLAVAGGSAWLGCSPPAQTPAKPAAAPSTKPASDASKSASVASSTPTSDAVAPAGQTPVTGASLYAQHCAACHGEKGDGKGLAATFLFPKPRDFRAGRFRLVSTVNLVPSAADLDAVIRRGMPGSAMPPWPKLSDKERSLVVAEVQRLHREGSRDHFVAQLKQDTGEENPEIDPQELEDYVKSRTVPAEVSATPTFGDSTAESVGRGKELYVKQGCVSCHGAEGKGDGQQVMVDIEGLLTRPRDLTRGIYKGGHDAASVYRRIALGMPGTPMPSSPNLKPEQIVDMVDFVRSLSDEPTRQAAILNRERLVAKRVAALPDSGADAAWKDAPTTTLRTMPLWWRDNFQSVVHVQAVHDGKALAFRLVWDDSTKNDSAVRVDEFEDLAAVQLTRGPAEPFLGMGAAPGALDLWQWRGGLGQTGAGDQLLDEYPFDRVVHRDHDKTKPLPDFITARASGNPLATGQHSGHSLIAIGPGSTTFRPAPSQHVAAMGEWNQNRWNVVLRRPLTVPADDGVALSSGGDFSAAFAVWDGATRDRGGQKLVTIWQDLHLE